MALFTFPFDNETLKHVASKLEQVREAFGEPHDGSTTELGEALYQIKVEVLDPYTADEVIGTIEYHGDGYFVFYPQITKKKEG